MAFQIVRNDISHIRADAIVNTANPRPVVGSGVDSLLHQKAGPGLLEARKAIGPIAPGCAAVTAAFNLDARYVIHAVGPVWQGGQQGEADCLRSCYDSALRLALDRGCTSIAFPLISTGNYGFPKDLALQIAISAFSSFLLEHEMQITLVVFNRDAYRLSEKLFSHVASYIDQNYVDTVESFLLGQPRPYQRQVKADRDYSAAPCCAPSPCASAPAKRPSLRQLLKKTDAGFSETLLKLIDKTGKKDSQIYKKANLSKQHFSKIRNNPNYQPTKATALALAIALELDLPQTLDLIGRAGYTLSNSSKFDLIIRYFIEQGNYNIVEINIALYEFDQNLLGGQ